MLIVLRDAGQIQTNRPALAVQFSCESQMSSKVDFFIINNEEWQALNTGGHVKPTHVQMDCGACGKSTNARVIAKCQRQKDGASILWTICACDREEPSMLLSRGGVEFAQFPEAKHFQAGERWPADLAQLYDEAAKSFAAGAYTASTMVARKLLMATACKEGDQDGKQFAVYVDYITNTVLTFPKAKDSIDRIRKIGNEANHSIQFVGRDDAKKAMDIVTYMLNTIYSLPTA